MWEGLAVQGPRDTAVAPNLKAALVPQLGGMLRNKKRCCAAGKPVGMGTMLCRAGQACEAALQGGITHGAGTGTQGNILMEAPRGWGTWPAAGSHCTR